MMTSPKKAKAKPRAKFSDWETPRVTALLVLADGTVNKGMPNGVVAHNAKGKFDVKKLLAMAKAWGGLEGLDLAKDVSLTQRMEWDEKVWDWTTGYTNAEGGKYKVVAIDYGLKRNILR